MGLILILLGGSMLADRLGLLVGREASLWSLVLAGVGIIFLVLATSERENWWVLIPTCLFLSLAALIYTAANNLLPGLPAVRPAKGSGLGALVSRGMCAPGRLCSGAQPLAPFIEFRFAEREQ